MFTNNSILFALLTVVLIILISTISETKSAPLDIEKVTQNHYPTAYRRYIRRRPPAYPIDKYVEDIFEVFYTKAKPAPYRSMTDEDVDRFIFCDFNRHLEECQNYWEERNLNVHRIKPVKPIMPIKPTSQPIVITDASITTSSSTTSTTTTTEFSIPHLVDNGYEGDTTGNKDETYDVYGEYEEENEETENKLEGNNDEYYN